MNVCTDKDLIMHPKMWCMKCKLKEVIEMMLWQQKMEGRGELHLDLVRERERNGALKE